MTAIAKKAGTTVARPLPVLVPLIKHELHDGYNAGVEHYRRAGEMLLEAREQIEHGEWLAWLKRNFALSETTARDYMTLAGKSTAAPRISSLREATRPAGDNGHASWAAPVRETLQRVNYDALRAERESRDKEFRLMRQLALQLIEIGYKVLATKLHPDKPGGSAEAMARLNQVRTRLRNAV